MLVHGRVGVRTYSEEEIGDPRVLALAGKVRYEVREYPSYPAAFPGGVRIRLRDGRVLEADAPYQLGGPENPMSADQVRVKFRENAALALDESGMAALEEAVLTLEEADDVSTLLAAKAAV
jgi:2-methylcitrate dehydratase PrpD